MSSKNRNSDSDPELPDLQIRNRQNTLVSESTLNAPEEEGEGCCASCGVLCCFGTLHYYTLGLLSRTARLIREAVFGDPQSINWGERGRNKLMECWCCCKKRATELRFGLILTIVGNFVDFAMDVLLLLKWLGGWDILGPLYNGQLTEPFDYPKREWEGYLLCTFIGMANFSSMILATKTRGRGCTWRIPFHAIGLGPMIEAMGAWNDDHYRNMTRFVNPFKWNEIILEKAPACVLTLYVGLNDLETPNAEFLSLETVAIANAMAGMAIGFGGLVTAASKQTDETSGGERGFLRTPAAMVVMLGDVTFRSLVFVLLLQHLPFWVEDKFGLEISGYVAWCMVFGVHYVLEMFYFILNKMYFKPYLFVLMLQSYVGVYNGSLLYFSRRWKSSRAFAEETEHYRTVYVFWLRYFVQWGILAFCYFAIAECHLGDPWGSTNCKINGTWFWSTVNAGLALPIFFYLKPPSKPLHNISPWAQEKMEKFMRERRERRDTANGVPKALPGTTVEMITSNSTVLSERRSSYDFGRKSTLTIVSEEEPTAKNKPIATSGLM